MRPVKEMQTPELLEERQFLKSWLFMSRYGNTFRIRNGKAEIIHLSKTPADKKLEARFQELTEELIKRRNEERNGWKPTEQE